MQHASPFGFATLTLGAALLGAPALAAPVFTDGFGDGDRDNDGTADGPVQDASDVGVPFYIGNGSNSNNSPAVSVVDDSAGIGSGNALSVSGNGNSSARRMLAGFDTVTLSNPGDFITLSFDARYNGTAPATDRRFRLGLYNQGALLTDEDFDGNSTNNTLSDDVGYYFQFDTGAASGTVADARIEFNTDGSPLGGSASSGDSESFGFGTDDALAALTNVAKNYEITITYVTATDANISLSVNGTELANRNLSEGGDATDVVSTYDFNGFMFGQNGAELSYLLDNVVIESNTVVPEPGTMSLVGLAGLTLLHRRRGA